MMYIHKKCKGVVKNNTCSVCGKSFNSLSLGFALFTGSVVEEVKKEDSQRAYRKRLRARQDVKRPNK